MMAADSAAPSPQWKEVMPLTSLLPVDTRSTTSSSRKVEDFDLELEGALPGMPSGSETRSSWSGDASMTSTRVQVGDPSHLRRRTTDDNLEVCSVTANAGDVMRGRNRFPLSFSKGFKQVVVKIASAGDSVSPYPDGRPLLAADEVSSGSVVARGGYAARAGGYVAGKALGTKSDSTILPAAPHSEALWNSFCEFASSLPSHGSEAGRERELVDCASTCSLDTCNKLEPRLLHNATDTFSVSSLNANAGDFLSSTSTATPLLDASVREFQREREREVEREREHEGLRLFEFSVDEHQPLESFGMASSMKTNVSRSTSLSTTTTAERRETLALAECQSQCSTKANAGDFIGNSVAGQRGLTGQRGLAGRRNTDLLSDTASVCSTRANAGDHPFGALKRPK